MVAKLKEMKCPSESTKRLTSRLKVLIYFFFCIYDNRPWHFFRCRFLVLFGWTFACHFLGRVHRIFSLSRPCERKRLYASPRIWILFQNKEEPLARFEKRFRLFLALQKVKMVLKTQNDIVENIVTLWRWLCLPTCETISLSLVFSSQFQAKHFASLTNQNTRFYSVMRFYKNHCLSLSVRRS